MEKNSFIKHKTLDFVVQVEDIYEIKFSAEWLKVAENVKEQSIIGTIVHDPKKIWGKGYRAEHWIPEYFEEVEDGYILNVDKENDMFEIHFLAEDITCYGGWYEGEIEWDGDGTKSIPSNYNLNAIEEKVKKDVI